MYTLGERLRVQRVSLGLTQTQVSERLAAIGLHYSQARLSRLERGWMGPTPELLAGLARVLNTTVAELECPANSPASGTASGPANSQVGGPANSQTSDPASGLASGPAIGPANGPVRRTDDTVTLVLAAGELAWLLDQLPPGQRKELLALLPQSARGASA